MNVNVNTCSSCGGGNALPADYVCSSGQTVVIANNNGTADFTALLAPYTISGYLKDNLGNPIPGVGIYASATINGTMYNQGHGEHRRRTAIIR